MSLGNFFRINLPYGIKRDNQGKWFAFNREYLPLGWNSTDYKRPDIPGAFAELPIYTEYKGLTKNVIRLLVDSGGEIQYNEKGEIDAVFFYNDRTNPSNKDAPADLWENYFIKIKILGYLIPKDLNEHGRHARSLKKD